VFTAAESSGRAGRHRPGAIVAVLAVATLACSIMQTVIIPLIPQLPDLLEVSTEQASWLVTATLVTGVISLPTVSRLADMFGKRRMILICLAALFVGSMMSVFGTGLAVQIAARALQGVSFALIPATFSILRDELPRERLTMAVALISATLGLGAAIGIPVAGVFFDLWGWHAVFWLAGALALMCMIAVIVVVPESSIRAGGRFDFLGAVVLSGALLALLLAITNGNHWGWLSRETIGFVAVAIALLIAWFPWELRVSDPLVDLRSSAARPVAMVNIASTFAGIAMFTNMIGTMQLLQTPAVTGYSAGMSVLGAGFVFLPIGLLFVVFAPLAARLIRQFGPERVLVLSCGFLFLGHFLRIWLMDSALQIVLGAAITAIGMTGTLSTLPVIIMKSVPIDETAAANGLNTLARTTGFAVASAAVAALVASASGVFDGERLPTQTAFVGVFVLGSAAAVIAGAIAAFLPRGGGRKAVDVVDSAVPVGSVVPQER